MNKIPIEIQRFIEAENSHDPEKMAACFSQDGKVTDEGRTYTGYTEILEWCTKITSLYQLTTIVEDCEVSGNTARVSVVVSGTFEGSPLHFIHNISFDTGYITSYQAELSE